MGPFRARTLPLLAALGALGTSCLVTSCGKGSERAARAGSPAPEGSGDSTGEGGGATFGDRCLPPGAWENGSATTLRSVTGAKAKAWDAVARFDAPGGGVCSGVLVDPTHLVTAAHCFEQGRTLGFVTFDGGEAAVRKVTVHPEYASRLAARKGLAADPSLANVDVAVVELASPARALPVPLASGEALPSGKLVALVGYGDTGGGAGTKRFAQSHVGRLVDKETRAGASYEDLLLLDSRTGTGACPGDSGGGVFVKDASGAYALLGVVHGVNDALYPGFPVASCTTCPAGIGIVTLLGPRAAFLERAGVALRAER